MFENIEQEIERNPLALKVRHGGTWTQATYIIVYKTHHLTLF